MDSLELVKRSEILDWGEPESIWITKVNGCFFISLTFYCDPSIYQLADDYQKNNLKTFTGVTEAIALVKELKPLTPIKIQYR